MLQANYWRFNFSATCSAIGAICFRSSVYYSSVQLAASPPATTSTGALGKYDFMNAKTWFGMDFPKCLTYVARRPGAFFSRSTRGAIFGPPGCGTSSLAMGSAASSSSLSCPQLLTVFIQLLQRFIAVDKVTIRGDPKLYVHITLMGQLLIIVLKYLTGILLSVEEILHIDF
jgi:hypothetical protein